jgi:beta-glucanase (GH16 family)
MARKRAVAAVLVIFGILLVVASCGGGSTTVPGSTSPPSSQAPWTLAWSDEFNGTNGSAPDASKWTYDIGGSGWGNDELETYTNRTQNAYLQDGVLIVQALQETYTGPDGIARNYTSARLKTQGLFQQTYGRFEARIKIPYGQGLWPAFWLLGATVGPGLPLPISRASSLTTAMTSAPVPVRKHSSPFHRS